MRLVGACCQSVSHPGGRRWNNASAVLLAIAGLVTRTGSSSTTARPSPPSSWASAGMAGRWACFQWQRAVCTPPSRPPSPPACHLLHAPRTAPPALRRSKPEELVHLEAAAAQHVPLIKRFTGGGTGACMGAARPA